MLKWIYFLTMLHSFIRCWKFHPEKFQNQRIIYLMHLLFCFACNSKHRTCSSMVCDAFMYLRRISSSYECVMYCAIFLGIYNKPCVLFYMNELLLFNLFMEFPLTLIFNEFTFLINKFSIYNKNQTIINNDIWVKPFLFIFVGINLLSTNR